MSNMDCTQARDLMLEAEMEELNGQGENILAQHIAACADCSRYAQRIVRGYADLEKGLASITAGAAKRRTRSRLLWIPVPLAAAALLTLLLVRGQDTVPDVTGITTRMFAQQPLVTPPEGRQAIVIEKNDLTVVWLY
jgi:hypothetical protein